MARKVLIQVADHNTEGVCSLYYTVRFKVASTTQWTTLTSQQPELYGSPAVYVLVINNLADDTEYDYEVTRHCCEGNNSNAATGTFDTTI